MAEEEAPKKKASKRKKLPEGVRLFREPVIKLVRMGREVMVYRGAFAKLDLGRERVELMNADVSVSDMVLKSDRLSLDLAENRLTADGRTSIEERGVHIESDGVTAQPSLSGLKLKGRVRVRTDSREAAEALLKSGKL